MPTFTSMPDPSQNKIDAYEINLLDVAIVLAKYKKLLVALPLISALIAAIISFQSPNYYTADTTFMPPKQASSVSSMLSSMSSVGSLSGMLGGGGAGGMGGQNDIYIAILSSRTMQDQMIKRFNLYKVYQTKSSETARKAIAGQTEVKTSKDGMIHLLVTDTDPKRASLLANGYVDELLESNTKLALSDAAQRRLFAESQFLKAKNTLADAELAVKQLQEKTGLITVGPQVAQLQGMINSTTRQLNDMAISVTANDPEYIKLHQKLSNLQGEIGKAQAGPAYATQAPERILDFTHKTRDLKYAEALYQMALQQLTLAKIDEEKSGSTIQIIDRATIPEQKSGPVRSRTILITSLAALFAAIIIAFLLEAIKRSKQNPESTTQYQTIKNHLKTWK